jgi:hypothetical protein
VPEQFGGGVDVADPAAFVGVAQHDPGDCEADQFIVGEGGSVAAAIAKLLIDCRRAVDRRVAGMTRRTVRPEDVESDRSGK